jgi:hypothetical protein
MLKDINWEPLAFYTGRYACKNHNINVKEVNQEPLTFCTWCCACKKHKINVNRRQSGAPCFWYVALRV